MSAAAGALEGVQGLHAELAQRMRADFDRDLPLPELLTDRWERGRRLGFGEGANIYDSAFVMGDVRVGEDTWIGPYTVLDGQRAPVVIGRGCAISAGTHVYTHDAVLRTLTGGREDFAVGPVTIGAHTYIGANVVVLHGVTIGEQCVVGAGSLVNRDLPDRSVAWGSPARVHGHVEVDADGGARLVLEG